MEKIQVFLIDVVCCPVNGRGGNGIKGLDRVEAADSLIVVSPDYREGFKRANFLDDFVRRGAVANQIAEKNVMVNFPSLDKFMKRKKRF